jgi:hypothetical protein
MRSSCGVAFTICARPIVLNFSTDIALLVSVVAAYASPTPRDLGRVLRELHADFGHIGVG